jgi:hypothetical protein
MLAIALLESETERRADRFRVAVPDGTENRGIHSGTVARDLPAGLATACARRAECKAAARDSSLCDRDGRAGGTRAPPWSQRSAEEPPPKRVADGRHFQPVPDSQTGDRRSTLDGRGCGQRKRKMAEGSVPDSQRCPKCGDHMEPGFVIDRAGQSNEQERWVEGEPTPRSWFNGVDLKRRTQIPVSTNRCVHCGYLESFAAPKTARG